MILTKELFVKVRSTGRLIKAKIDINNTSANVNLLRRRTWYSTRTSMCFLF